MGHFRVGMHTSVPMHAYIRKAEILILHMHARTHARRQAGRQAGRQACTPLGSPLKMKLASECLLDWCSCADEEALSEKTYRCFGLGAGSAGKQS